MRIALMTDTYHPQVNGVVTSIDTIAAELGRKHELHIFAPTKARKAHGFRSFKFHPYPDYRIALFRPKTLVNMFKKLEIDLVHVHTPFSLGLAGVSAARNMGLPVVGTFHTMLPEYTHYISRPMAFLLKWMAWRYVRWFYRRCNVVTTPSSPIRDSLINHKVRNVYVMPNAIDTKIFKPKSRPKSIDPNFLFVGRLGREKKLEVLIDAARMILDDYPHSKFRIIGMGVHEGVYRNLVKKRRVANSFIFKKFVAPSVLVKTYQNSDVFMMPSDTETLGLVVLESMACGTPAVGANALGVRDLITHGKDGYLFTPGSSEELAEYSLELIENERKRREFGKRARRKAEEFSAEGIGKQWTDFYSALLSGR